MGRKSILASDPVVMPDGSKMTLVNFLSWAKSFDHDQPPQHGSMTPIVCEPATILHECFPCSGGPINGGAPGPVCGWTFRSPFGGKGGQVSFAGDMLLQGMAFSEAPGASKPGAFPPILSNLTWQYTFTEYSAPVGGGTSLYDNYLVSSSGFQAVELRMVDNGTLLIAVGPTVSASFHTGHWFPNNGTHQIHVAIDGGGNPFLWIDGIPIPLTPAGSGSINIGSLPHGVVFFSGSSGPFFPDEATIRSVFVTANFFPPTTVFCC